MDVLPSAYYETVKRYWRRRKYRRVHGTNSPIRRKLKVARLGGYGNRCNGQYSKITKAPEPQIITPIKLLAKFHKGYINMVTGLFFGGNKKVGKDHRISVISTGEEVDSYLAMEIYKKFAASRAREAAAF